MPCAGRCRRQTSSCTSSRNRAPSRRCASGSRRPRCRFRASARSTTSTSSTSAAGRRSRCTSSFPARCRSTRRTRSAERVELAILDAVPEVSDVRRTSSRSRTSPRGTLLRRAPSKARRPSCCASSATRQADRRASSASSRPTAASSPSSRSALDPHTELQSAHATASAIEERIRQERPEISEVHVHRRGRCYGAAVKLCMFSPVGRDLERGWPGRIEGDRVIQLAAQTLQSFFTGGGQARAHDEFAARRRRPARPRCSSRRRSATSTRSSSTSARRGRRAASTCPRSGTRSPSSTSRTRGRLRAGGRDPVPGGKRGARLRARARRGDRSRASRSPASR